MISQGSLFNTIQPAGFSAAPPLRVTGQSSPVLSVSSVRQVGWMALVPGRLASEFQKHQTSQNVSKDDLLFEGLYSTSD